MKLLYSETLDGICIQRCFGLDGVVQLPDQVDGRRVCELGPYAFSQSMGRAMAARGGFKGPLFIWDSDTGRSGPGTADTENCQGLPAVCGTGVQELKLPPGVAKVGAYAFYGCEKLRVFGCSSTIGDWGAGAFTGCTGMEKIAMRVVPGERSSLKEVLFELRQLLYVDYLDQDGSLKARLVFPEFYEDSVENTPARFIMREMHGCGHMYRYCFEETAFSFREYDRLFDNVCIQEGPRLSSQLALFRLYWPYGLSEGERDKYWSYIEGNAAQAARAVMESADTGMARWLAESPGMERPQLEAMIHEAGQEQDTQMMALFMDVLHRRFNNSAPARRKFEL